MREYLSVEASVLNQAERYAPTLRELWDPTLFEDIFKYIEVGEIRLSDTHLGQCRLLELWVVPSFARNCVRPECRTHTRRRICGVLAEIERLCDGRDTCVLIMEDDVANGTDISYRALYPIVVYLKLLKYIKAVVLYTKQTPEAISAPDAYMFLAESDRRYHTALYQTVDAYIARQANRFAVTSDRKVIINQKCCSVYVDMILKASRE